jgi:hypothetical protein
VRTGRGTFTLAKHLLATVQSRNPELGRSCRVGDSGEEAGAGIQMSDNE